VSQKDLRERTPSSDSQHVESELRELALHESLLDLTRLLRSGHQPAPGTGARLLQDVLLGTARSATGFAADLEEWSKEFAEESTLLSRRIEQLERWILALPGKVPVRVGNDALAVVLSRDKDGWQLSIETADKLALMDAASVQLKAKAARLLPDLIDTLMRESRTRAAEAGEARRAMDQLFAKYGIPETRS
jgi:hypothetical protein